MQFRYPHIGPLFVSLWACALIILVQADASWALTPTDAEIGGQDQNIGLQMMADFEKLPQPKDFTAKHESSYDRNGTNMDRGWFLNGHCSECKWDYQGCIMLDADGPGVVTRIWHTAPDYASFRFNLYIDHNPDPVVSCTRDELFDRESCYPFVDLFVGNADSSAGGYYSYFPIPFVEHVKITATEITDCGFFFNIDYLIFPQGVEISSFSGGLSEQDQENFQRILDTWHSLGANPTDTSGFTVNGAVAVPANDTLTFASITGRHCIHELRASVFPSDTSALNHLALKIYWDGEETPSVDAPLGAFFGNGIDVVPFRSLPVGLSGSEYYSYFPMPFCSSAVFQLDNQSTQGVSCNYRILYRTIEAGAPFYKFHARYNQARPTTPGANYVMLEASGTGHYVGTALSIISDDDWSPLEGDEMFYLDGETEPSIHGTGTEDYFNCGWYFQGHHFLELPYHGLSLFEYDRGESGVFPAARLSLGQPQGFSAHRFHISDVIPFTSSVRATFEHGPNNYVSADYLSVAYYYMFDCPVQTCGDTNCDFVIDIGDVVYLLNYLFRGQQPPVTPAMGDTNADGVIDLGDVIYLINYLFKGGPPPCEG